jgi:hypothetical protein
MENDMKNITSLIRLLFRNQSINHPYSWGLAGFDWSEPSGGGAIEVDKKVQLNPLLPFVWLRNNIDVSEKNCSNWMKTYRRQQKCWITRAKFILDTRCV